MFRQYSFFLMVEIILKEIYSVLKKEEHYTFSIFILVFSLSSLFSGSFLALVFTIGFILSFFFYKDFYINLMKNTLNLVKDKKENALISEIKRDKYLKKYSVDDKNLKIILNSLNKKNYTRKANYSNISLILEKNISLDINTFNILGYRIGKNLNKKYAIEEFKEDLKTGEVYSIGVPYKINKKSMNIENIDLIDYKFNLSDYRNNLHEKTIEIEESESYYDIFSLNKSDFFEKKESLGNDSFIDHKLKTNKKELKKLLIANLLFVILLGLFINKTILSLMLGLFLTFIFYSFSKLFLINKENTEMTNQKIELLNKHLTKLGLKENSHKLKEVSLFYRKTFSINNYSYYFNKESDLKVAYVDLNNDCEYSDNNSKISFLLEYKGQSIPEGYMKYRKDYNLTEKSLLDENIIKMYLMTVKI